MVGTVFNFITDLKARESLRRLHETLTLTGPTVYTVHPPTPGTQPRTVNPSALIAFEKPPVLWRGSKTGLLYSGTESKTHQKEFQKRTPNLPGRAAFAG